MSTTLGRKAWRDLGRRRARAVLTAATIALAVAGTGMLAVPSLIDRTMTAEVRDSRLYDIALPVRDMPFDATTARELEAVPNVREVSARTTYSTRALVGDRRIPATICLMRSRSIWRARVARCSCSSGLRSRLTSQAADTGPTLAALLPR